MGGFFSESGANAETQAETFGAGLNQSQPVINMQKLMPNSSEILFLKRLLYLKASIDNESTINAFSVPFQEEKARDAADKE